MTFNSTSPMNTIDFTPSGVMYSSKPCCNSASSFCDTISRTITARMSPLLSCNLSISIFSISISKSRQPQNLTDSTSEYLDYALLYIVLDPFYVAQVTHLVKPSLANNTVSPWSIGGFVLHHALYAITLFTNRSVPVVA